MSNLRATERLLEQQKQTEDTSRDANQEPQAPSQHGPADLDLATVQKLQLAAIVESSEDAIIGCSLAGHITIWNKGAERLFGYSAEEVMGEITSTNAQLPWPDEMKALKKVRRGEHVPPFETARRRKDGTELHVSVSISPIREPNGRITGASLICRDITETKRLEQQVLQAQKMEAIGQLAGGVAHDFNNLLTVINGYSDLLLNHLPAGDPMRQLLTEIYRAGERARVLTRQLLAFSRKQVLEPKVLDLNVAVSDTQNMLRRLIREDIILTFVPSPTAGRVKVDPGQLEQVLMNLAVNARDAMPQGGRITIGTRGITRADNSAQNQLDGLVGEYAMLAFSDTGCGMDDAIKARIFEPFFTTKGPDKGTGLGLATVYGIVKQSGGAIEVDSELGRGTTFKIYFPQVLEPVSTSKSVPAIRIVPQGSETVLLVEDEDSVRSVARHVLWSSGYTVLEAADGQKALQLVEGHKGPIDLLLSDVVMPHVAGRQLVEHLQVLRPGIKVLFMSGYTDDAVVRHGVLEADYAFLQKPFTPSVLAQKVRAVLDGTQ